MKLVKYLKPYWFYSIISPLMMMCEVCADLCLPFLMSSGSLDTRTEMNIQQTMLNLMENRTSPFIAHRLSTICEADVIVVLRGGEMAERGSHDELLALNGEYANLYCNQFAGIAT